MPRPFLAILLLSLAAACSKPELQTVTLQGYGHFQVPKAWELHGEVEGELGFVHAELPGVELWVKGDIEDFGTALTVEHIRVMLGKQANLDYGGAISRLSMGGNAVIRHPIRGESQDEPDALRWIVAQPHRGGLVRMDVSIEYMPGEVPQAELDALFEAFDPGVSDARFTRI